MRGEINHEGKRINRITVIQKSEQSDKGNHYYYLCRCDCGNEWNVSSANIGKLKECPKCSFKHREQTRIRDYKSMKHRYLIPNVGKRVQDILNDKDINITDMAARTGVSRTAIYNFVYSGMDISSARLAKICAYCGVSMDYVMGLKKEA